MTTSDPQTRPQAAGTKALLAGTVRRAAVGAFLIAGAALIRAALRILWQGGLWSLASYNTLFVPLFAMFGLLCLVMSALFRQAAELKAENDLTI